MADSASDPEVLAAIAAVKQAFATILIGFAIATTYVITLRQWLDAYCNLQLLWHHESTSVSVLSSLYEGFYLLEGLGMSDGGHPLAFAITADCMINTGCLLMVRMPVI